MGPFRCTTCGTSTDRATSCAACGGRTFMLAREARSAASAPLGGPAQPEGRGQLVSIRDAPSLRLGRRPRPRRRR